MDTDALIHRLARNIAAVRARIDAACTRAGRDPASVALLPATKTAGAGMLRAFMALGITRFGENQVRQAGIKAEALGPGARFDMIGHLQRNKVKTAVKLFETIQSVDSVRLAEEIDRRAAPAVMPVLLEVNVGGEPSKHGVAPGDVFAVLERLQDLAGLRVDGLMTVAPYHDDPERARPCFARLREWRDAARARGLGDGRLATLSMGMSHDLEAAIAEGATVVRVGSALLEGVQ